MVRKDERRVAGAALVGGLTDVLANEQRQCLEMAIPARVRVGGRAIGMQMRDLNVAQVVAARDERLDQWGGSDTGPLEIDAVARCDDLYGLMHITPGGHDSPPAAPSKQGNEWEH